MRLSDKRYEEIKQEVANMFIDYGIRSVPINPFEVCKRIGIEVIPYSRLNKEKRNKSLETSLDGYSVETLEGKWQIYYNDYKKNRGRINQTIMHEVAHYILGHIEDGEEEEAEAGFFAKYALASPPLIHNLCTLRSIDEVKETFDISHDAAKNALVNYDSWMRYGEKNYVVYEEQILKQFGIEYD